jgi:glycosyltransferase involved in cell wall biosynthesis
MPRIVHVSLRYPPASGGAENYVQDIVELTRSVDLGRDVRVLTSKLRTHAPATLLPAAALRQDPVYVQRLEHAVTPGIAYPRLQALSYYLGHHKPDIIHGYSFWYQPADGAARYSARHNIPFIFHPLYYTNAIRKKIKWQLYAKTIGRGTFARADVTVVISPFEQSLIEEAGFPVKRFALIPPSINLDEFAAAHENPFAARNISGRVLMTASRLAPGKGLEDAVTAFVAVAAKYPDVHLAIIGEDFGAKKVLRQLVKQSQARERIHFLGKLERSALVGAFQHAYGLLHPSLYEAFGIVLAEAGAASIPVIARNVAAMPYVIKQNETGLLWNTKEEFVDQLKVLLDNPQQAQGLGMAGKEYISQNFSQKSLTDNILRLYDELAIA